MRQIFNHKSTLSDDDIIEFYNLKREGISFTVNNLNIACWKEGRKEGRRRKKQRDFSLRLRWTRFFAYIQLTALPLLPHPLKNVSPAESTMQWNRLEIFNKFPCLMSGFPPPRTIPPFSEFFFKKIVHKLGRFYVLLLLALHLILHFLPLSMHALPHLRTPSSNTEVSRKWSELSNRCPRWGKKKKEKGKITSFSLFFFFHFIIDRTYTISLFEIVN